MNIEKRKESGDLFELLGTTHITSELLRLIVSQDSYCYKAVNYLPASMGKVSFDVKVNTKKRTRNISEHITWINDCLRKLIPWFVEAQTQANIVGRSYLIFNVRTNNNETSLTDLIIWDNSITGVEAKKVFGCDECFYDKSDNYLIKKESHINKVSNIDESYIDKLKSQSKDNNLDIIHKSHVLEFVAFDYQDDSEQLKILSNRKTINRRTLTSNHDYFGISFRLTRFLKKLKKYNDFIDSTLERMKKSEATIYKKENLGETNQSIARHLSNTSDNQLQINVSEVIKSELTELRDSLHNFGIALVDSKNDVEMLSRPLNGIAELHKIFTTELISSSGLTEYVLFGFSSGGSGLAGEDDRDKAELAKHTDELFESHWKPILLWVAHKLAECSPRYSKDSHILSIDAAPSYESKPSEQLDILSTKIDVLIKLLESGVIDKETILNEITTNNSLGRNFTINEDEIRRLLA